MISKVITHILICSVGFVTLATPTQANTPTTIRFYAPTGPLSLPLEKQMESLIQEFNQLHPQTRVEWVKKGEDFSTIKEIITGSFASLPIDLAVIEWSEEEALKKTSLAKKISPELKKKLLPTYSKKDLSQHSLPFQLTVPALLADQELLYRAHLDPNKIPQNWEQLLHALERLYSYRQKTQTEYLIGIPLLGGRGLWMFESLFSETQPISKIQETLTKKMKGRFQPNNDFKTSLYTEQAVRAFSERKAPFLVGSTDLFPIIASQSVFRWSAVPLFGAERAAQQPASGSRLIIVRETTEVKQFIEYLYSPRVAARWTTAGGFLPLEPAWTQTPEWKQAGSTLGDYIFLLTKFRTQKFRQSDEKTVRKRADQIQEIHKTLLNSN